MSPEAQAIALAEDRHSLLSIQVRPDLPDDIHGRDEFIVVHFLIGTQLGKPFLQLADLDRRAITERQTVSICHTSPVPAREIIAFSLESKDLPISTRR